jgi:hypothetical protein
MSGLEIVFEGFRVGRPVRRDRLGGLIPEYRVAA